MGKTQKSISIPTDSWIEIEKLYNEKKPMLETLRIKSTTQLFLVLANFGKKPFEEFLEGKKPMTALVETHTKDKEVSK